jgi:hypothetical protein
METSAASIRALQGIFAFDFHMPKFFREGKYSGLGRYNYRTATSPPRSRGISSIRNNDDPAKRLGDGVTGPHAFFIGVKKKTVSRAWITAERCLDRIWAVVDALTIDHLYLEALLKNRNFNDRPRRKFRD